jgi:hypothetical protein
MLLENKDLDLFYYSYYKQDLIVQRVLYGFESLSAIIKYINRYYLFIIIKKTINKKQEIINQ